jgi:hypothetical protein
LLAEVFAGFPFALLTVSGALKGGVHINAHSSVLLRGSTAFLGADCGRRRKTSDVERVEIYGSAERLRLGSGVGNIGVYEANIWLDVDEAAQLSVYLLVG